VAEQRQASALVWLVLLLGPLPSLVQDGPVPLVLLVWLVLRVSPEPVPAWRGLPF
jgi:hypothetical protein